MKSKKLAIVFSLFAASAGANRFYLGQNNRGWVVLGIWWVLFPGLWYLAIKENLYLNHFIFMLLLFALPILFHLFETGRYLVTSAESFKSQDKSVRNTLPLTFASIFIVVVLISGELKLLAGAGSVDITKTEASVQLKASEMSAEYRADEIAFRKKYDNKVLQIEGTVAILPGEDLETGAKFVELVGDSSDVFGIKCFFKKENSGNVDEILAGDRIVVKGECSGNSLQNSQVMEIIH